MKYERIPKKINLLKDNAFVTYTIDDDLSYPNLVERKCTLSQKYSFKIGTRIDFSPCHKTTKERRMATTRRQVPLFFLPVDNTAPDLID